jgi:hypothetical protein
MVKPRFLKAAVSPSDRIVLPEPPLNPAIIIRGYRLSALPHREYARCPVCKRYVLMGKTARERRGAFIGMLISYAKLFRKIIGKEQRGISPLCFY